VRFCFDHPNQIIDTQTSTVFPGSIAVLLVTSKEEVIRPFSRAVCVERQRKSSRVACLVSSTGWVGIAATRVPAVKGLGCDCRTPAAATGTTGTEAAGAPGTLKHGHAISGLATKCAPAGLNSAKNPSLREAPEAAHVAHVGSAEYASLMEAPKTPKMEAPEASRGIGCNAKNADCDGCDRNSNSKNHGFPFLELNHECETIWHSQPTRRPDCRVSPI
jgi:hypothetical protein